MHIQLLYIQQLEDNYKLINALVLTQSLHTNTQLHCDSENQTKLHFQITPTIHLLGVLDTRHKTAPDQVWSAADHRR